MTLEEFFNHHSEVAVAFSGGVDSAYLLYCAIKYAKRVRAYYVKTAFQPEFEYRDAEKLAGILGADMRVIEEDILKAQEVCENPHNRCYHCKKNIFGKILEAAAQDGFHTVIDGTNASDRADDRPGMKALAELEVKSPLRECSLTKDEIRKRSNEAGLFTWSKPAYACLATRIPTGERITAEKLEITEKAEDYLFSLGYTDFRVRMKNADALIQVKAEQYEKLEKEFGTIKAELEKYYKNVTPDSEVKR